MNHAEWQARATAVSDAELADFREIICSVRGHIALCACGTCSRCSGRTPSCSMLICGNCASELGVCPFDQRMTAWGSVSAPDEEAIAVRWLALLMCGYSDERAAAMRALQTFPLPGLVEAANEIEQRGDRLTRSPARAEFIIGFHGPPPHEVVEGAVFLEGTVMRVNTALAFAVIQTGDAVRFEALAAQDPRVRYVELNAPGG